MIIYDFKTGDVVVRIAPAKPCSGDGTGDRSYLGEKLIFIGIANGQIYLKRTDSFSINTFGDNMIDLDLDLWDEKWEYYIDPNTLSEIGIPLIDSSTLETQLKNAITSENYELATKIKKLIDNKK